MDPRHSLEPDWLDVKDVEAHGEGDALASQSAATQSPCVGLSGDGSRL